MPPEQNAAFVCAMEDVLDVYEQSLDVARPVVCFDEKPCQLLQEVLQPIEPKPGQVKREESEYVRCGTANLFGWVEPLTGKRDVWVTDRRTSVDYAHALERLAAAYPEAEKIVLVQDNLSTHSKSALYQAFSPEKRRSVPRGAVFAKKARTLAQRSLFHFTPRHGSWLNMRAGVLMGVRSAQESGAGVVSARPAGLEGAGG
ncbi:IS630 family transposase [Deinococcus altitudinis]|uniref:IS630 family transposase n=1 Tax=Deinococcus altitudinis TaxID=468914 RepID=UPI003891AF95